MDTADTPLAEDLQHLLKSAGRTKDGRPTAMSGRALARAMGYKGDGSRMLKGYWFPSQQALERAATALGVSPYRWKEYRLDVVRELLDWRPEHSRRGLTARQKARDEAYSWYRRLGLEEAMAREAAGRFREVLEPSADDAREVAKAGLDREAQNEVDERRPGRAAEEDA